MRGPYWVANDERAPTDAVRVCVIEETSEVTAQEPGVVFAMVQWVMFPPGEGTPISRSEGPFEMGAALDYAEEIAGLYGLFRVVVAISDNALWRGEWGTLTKPSKPS